MGQIPLVDLKAQVADTIDQIRVGIDRVIANTSFILGGEVADFERTFAEWSGVKHCIGVANGTDALELALRACDIGRGDEVIVPANTFIATGLAAERVGAKVVLVDSDPVYHLLDPARLEAAITPATKAIMPVHLYGQAAPMEDIQRVIEGSAIHIVEDAAQAQGAVRNGVRVGAFGQAAGTSFYPGKNLGAFGDAGGVLTAHDEIAAKVRALRNYGSEVKYEHPVLGFNSRLDPIQAVVLTAKLAHLADWNQKRREAADRYDAMLADLSEVVRPATMPGNTHIWHLYVIRVPRRDATLAALHEAGIGAGIHYPTPMHLHGAFSHLGYSAGDFPVAEKAAGEILSLPIDGHIDESKQQRVVDALRKGL